MALSTLPLSYCCNVHPGQTLPEARTNLERYSVPLARAVEQRTGKPIAAGLWLPVAAARELVGNPKRLTDLKLWLDNAGLSCYTLNAFPYGDFHAERVKENVFLPDWSTPDRVDFTAASASILAGLLPEGGEGSISTSPLGLKALWNHERDYARFVASVLKTARQLAELRLRTGRTIRLAIEPEPLALLETTAEAIAFFEQLRQAAAESALLDDVIDHIGLCFDICHQSVEFEEIADSIDRIEKANVRINKVHITNALELENPRDATARRHLARFAEPRYFHQTLALTSDGRVLRHADLSAEFANAPPAEWLDAERWRIHFHVPVDRRSLGPLAATRPAIDAALARVAKLPYAPHLEVETYTWGVFPDDGGPAFDLVEGLANEMASALWAIEAAAGTAP